MATNRRKKQINKAYVELEAKIEEIQAQAAKSCENLAQRLEEEHKEEAVMLHNRFAAVIEEIESSPENTLLVLELIKHEVMDSFVNRMPNKSQGGVSNKWQQSSRK